MSERPRCINGVQCRQCPGDWSGLGHPPSRRRVGTGPSEVLRARCPPPAGPAGRSPSDSAGGVACARTAGPGGRQWHARAGTGLLWQEQRAAICRLLQPTPLYMSRQPHLYGRNGEVMAFVGEGAGLSKLHGSSLAHTPSSPARSRTSPTGRSCHPQGASRRLLSQG